MYYRNNIVIKYIHIVFILSIIAIAQNAKSDPWGRHVIDGSSRGADGVKVADINNDNLPDIATGFEEEGVSKVFIHPGYTAVKEEWPSVIVGSAPRVEDAAFADIDGNGILDVISCTEGGSKKILIHWAPQKKDDILKSSAWETDVLTPSQLATGWMYAEGLQLDGKNGLDIVAGSKEQNAVIGWFEAPEDPKNVDEWQWHKIATSNWVMSLILRDMDGDGDQDVVVSERDTHGYTNGVEGVRWLENPGPGESQKQEWNHHFIGAKGLNAMFMELADLDGDGLEDAVVTEYTNQTIIFMKRLDSSGTNWEEYVIDLPTISGEAKSVTVGDINGDSTPDLVHSSWIRTSPENKEGVFWMSVKTSVTDHEWNWHTLSGPEGSKYDRVRLLDMDGDNDLDVLTCEEDFGENSEGLGVIWYENPFGPAAITQDLTSKAKMNFTLNQNYPNPFNLSTTIKYSVQSTDYIQIKVYNSLGKLIKILIQDSKAPGVYSITWDGKDQNNIVVPSGVYYYQLQTKNYTSSKKMVLLK